MPRFPNAPTIGGQNLWVNKYTIRYDERPYRVVGIMEFRDGEVGRERIHFGESSERRPGGHNGSSGWTLRPASVCVTCGRLSEPRWPPISVSGRSVDRSARRIQLRRTHAGRRGHV